MAAEETMEREDVLKETAQETKEAVDSAADNVMQSANANAGAVETAVENKEAASEAADAVSESASANADAVEHVAENTKAFNEVANAVEEGAKKNTGASETAAENMRAAAEVAEAVKSSADKNTKASETAAENKQAVKAGPSIPKTKDESMNDYKDEIDRSMKRVNKGNLDAWEKLEKALEEKTPIEVEITEAVKAGVVCHPEGVRGFIPASKLSLSFVDEKDLPSYVGKTLRVQVITCDMEGNKLVLSAKDLLREEEKKARAEKISHVKIGHIAEGIVDSLKDFGAFIDLGDGMSGLVHVSQIANRRIAHPKDVLKIGDKVKVKVTAIKDGKLSLSMKALEEDVAPQAEESPPVEYKSEGKVTTSLADLIKNAGF